MWPRRVIQVMVQECLLGNDAAVLIVCVYCTWLSPLPKFLEVSVVSVVSVEERHTVGVLHQ